MPEQLNPQTKNANQLLNDIEAAAYLGISKQTLANWRHLGKGPVYYKMSEGPRGPVRYFQPDLDSYRDQRRIDPEAN